MATIILNIFELSILSIAFMLPLYVFYIFVKMYNANEAVKHRGFHHNGYNYGVKNAERTRYGCIKKGCPAKLYINADHDENSIRLSNDAHICLKSTHESLGKKNLRKLCQINAAASMGGTPKEIFDRTCLENRDIASEASFPSLQKSIQRAQTNSATNPGVKRQYSSIREFGIHLQENPNLLTHKEKDQEFSISAQLIQSSSKTDHVILFDETLINEFENENDMGVDGTFRIIPDIKGVKQVLTIMCKKYNTYVPCAWVLMSKRTTNAYKAVWEEIKRRFPKFKPRKAMCDYEKALIRSIRESFSGVIVRGCYFHFCQAIVRKAKSKDYRLFLRKDNKLLNPDGHEIIKKILVIPLLPADKVQEAVTIIKNSINEKFKNEPRKLKKWNKFISGYFVREWIKTVTPKVFSVYNLVDRTNNYLESYHRSLNETLRTKPSVSTFLFGIIKVKEKSILDLQRAKKKLKPTVGPKEYTRLRDEIIRNAWLEMQSSVPWSVNKFLNELSGYDDESVFELIEQIDGTEEMEEDESETDDSDTEDEDDFEDFFYDMPDVIAETQENNEVMVQEDEDTMVQGEENEKDEVEEKRDEEEEKKENEGVEVQKKTKRKLTKKPKVNKNSLKVKETHKARKIKSKNEKVVESECSESKRKRKKKQDSAYTYF